MQTWHFNSLYRNHIVFIIYGPAVNTGCVCLLNICVIAIKIMWTNNRIWLTESIVYSLVTNPRRAPKNPFWHIVLCLVNLRYCLRIAGARTMFCRVIEKKSNIVPGFRVLTSKGHRTGFKRQFQSSEVTGLASHDAGKAPGDSSLKEWAMPF